MMNQRISGFYNAQCCGIAFEYQNYHCGDRTADEVVVVLILNAQCCGIAFEYQNYHYFVGSTIAADHRFFMSFTLAGLGNFSPFNGALGGVPR